ncbi:hypothetical protein SpCBS45565_g04649 [Spizellomyces sp. 'palustris']|nr:hypothetical protein SpCBS45565_g04649 [Spizellomyces sp. 'palustris']
MKLFETEYLFAHPWCTLTLANWKKYPNQYSSHVLSVDVLDRSVDPETGILTTERLLCCKQSAPALLRRILPIPEVAYFREISYLDPRSQTYTAISTNLSMRSFINLEEKCEYKADPEHPEGKTFFTQQAAVSAMGVLSYGAKLVEESAVKSFHKNAARGRQGLETIVEKMVEEAKAVEQGFKDGLETHLRKGNMGVTEP